MKHAITIAVRYAAVRRQFSNTEGEPEQQILNYATHEYRLMPLLAAAYALHFTSMRLQSLFTESKERSMNDDFSLLKDLHTTAAGLKPICTWLTHYAIDECRQVRFI